MSALFGILAQIFVRTVSAILATIALYYIMKSIKLHPATATATATF